MIYKTDMSAPQNTELFVFATALPHRPPPDKPLDGGPTKPPSFRDILAEGQGKTPVKEMVDLISNGLVKVSFEEGNRLKPQVMLDEKYFQDLCNPWKEALVINLIGKNVGYQLMKDRLKKMWKFNGGFHIIDVDNGFYMVKCELLADREKIV